MKILPLLFSLFFITSCNNSNVIPKNPLTLEQQALNTTSCQLIEKEFVNKGGKITDYKELYLRCSIQDYFIKVCEGKVSEKELRIHLDKGITVEMEIKNGMWDHCSDNPAYAQSRTGTYVVINKIVE